MQHGGCALYIPAACAAHQIHRSLTASKGGDKTSSEICGVAYISGVSSHSSGARYWRKRLGKVTVVSHPPNPAWQAHKQRVLEHILFPTRMLVRGALCEEELMPDLFKRSDSPLSILPAAGII